MPAYFDSGGFLDPDEVRDYLRGEEVLDAKLEVAEEGRDYARSIAPVDTGLYRDGIEVQEEGEQVFLAFTDPISNIIEYGSEDTPEFAVRRRTEEYMNRGVETR